MTIAKWGVIRAIVITEGFKGLSSRDMNQSIVTAVAATIATTTKARMQSWMSQGTLNLELYGRVFRDMIDILIKEINLLLADRT